MKLHGIYEKLVLNRTICAVLRSKGFKNKDIAEIVGITENTVKSHNKRWKDSGRINPSDHIRLLIHDLTQILELQSETIELQSETIVELQNETKITKDLTYTKESLNNNTIHELRDICRALGESVSGSKITVMNRILKHQEQNRVILSS